ncbi:ATP:cob(I)alamin adenosyltransferase [Streptococcus sanguinis]|uniref:ATP:cob(I)alamin adenosyltransferase n=1 Tax=Streptococcus sanguinis TaxID=1305 RepID=A0A7Y0YRU4_STRSA|nr:ATP:cob(I)alamin adenosyltransferase [Streptococcus sanguinis]
MLSLGCISEMRDYPILDDLRLECEESSSISLTAAATWHRGNCVPTSKSQPSQLAGERMDEYMHILRKSTAVIIPGGHRIAILHVARTMTNAWSAEWGCYRGR